MTIEQLTANHDAPPFLPAVGPVPNALAGRARAFWSAAALACLALSAGSLAACGSDGTGSPATKGQELMSICASACKHMVSAGCRGAASVSRCEDNCFEQLASEEDCSDEWTDVWTCFSSARFTCTADGSASTRDCAAESKVVSACAR